MKRAETIAEVGVLPLSRRDRAAMELALEAMRVHVHAEACIADELAGDAIEVARCALKCGSSWSVVAGELCAWLRYARRRVPPRLLRARLALALRVLLRANEEHGGYEPDMCSRCHGSGEVCGRYSDEPCHECDGGGMRWVPIDMRPLWQDAPAFDGRSAKERREGLASALRKEAE